MALSTEIPHPKRTSGEFIARHSLTVDLIGLLVSMIIVHIVYVVYINPAASDILATAAEAGDVPERAFVIVLHGIEQELCLICTLWCFWLWFFRFRFFQGDSYLLDLDILRFDLLDIDTSTSSPEVLDAISERIQELRTTVQGTELINALDIAVQRIRLNGNFHEASDAAIEACDLHLELLHSNLSISKYLLWAVPSIGFLGTVRGIGEALSKANEAMAGDISGVGASLGVAFNSTYVALFMSLILMLASSSLLGREERLVAKFKHRISATFIPSLSARLLLDAETQGKQDEEPFE